MGRLTAGRVVKVWMVGLVHYVEVRGATAFQSHEVGVVWMGEIRTDQTRPRGALDEAHDWPFTDLVYCPSCEALHGSWISHN